MNAAKLERSERMQAILAFMRERGTAGATSLEIAVRFNVLNVGTEMSALRHNGVNVDCEFERETETGRRVYRYHVVA